MPDSDLARLESVATEALKVAQRTASDFQVHDEVCEKVRALNEHNQRQNEKFQDEMRSEFLKWTERMEDGLKMVRESLNIQQQAQTDRLNSFMSDISVRQSNTARTIIESTNKTVELVSQTITEGLKGANAALAAFINAQTETNKFLSENIKGVGSVADKAMDRNWQLGTAILVMAVTGMLGLAAAYGKAKNWW